MSVSFNHKDKIIAIKEGLPKLLTKNLGKDYEKKEFTIHQLKEPFRKGIGDKEKIIDENVIKVERKSVPLTFIEDISGKLDILVHDKISCLIKPTGRLNSNIIKSISRSVKEALDD
jgi:hypothetical protein